MNLELINLFKNSLSQINYIQENAEKEIINLIEENFLFVLNSSINFFDYDNLDILVYQYSNR